MPHLLHELCVYLFYCYFVQNSNRRRSVKKITLSTSHRLQFPGSNCHLQASIATHKRGGDSLNCNRSHLWFLTGEKSLSGTLLLAIMNGNPLKHQQTVNELMVASAAKVSEVSCASQDNSQSCQLSLFMPPESKELPNQPTGGPAEDVSWLQQELKEPAK